MKLVPVSPPPPARGRRSRVFRGVEAEIGDVLWVAEPWATTADHDPVPSDFLDSDEEDLRAQRLLTTVWYRRDGETARSSSGVPPVGVGRSQTRGRWRPAHEMPLWAVRELYVVTLLARDRSFVLAAMILPENMQRKSEEDGTMAMPKGARVERTESKTLVLYLMNPDGSEKVFSEADPEDREQVDYLEEMAGKLGAMARLTERTTTVRTQIVETPYERAVEEPPGFE